MRPIRSLLLLLIFLALFTGLHYLLPSGELFPSVNEFLSQDFSLSVPAKGTYEDSIHINTDSVKLSEINEKEDTSRAITAADTIAADSVISDTTFTDSLTIISKPDPVKVFMDSLNYSTGQVRIIYYGDSQIEGDRITSYLRQLLRDKRGGTGPGLFLPVMPVMYTKSYFLKASSNWKRYNYLSYKNREISYNDLGPFMAICRYLPEGEKSLNPVKASVSVRPAKNADSASAVYEHLRIFYGNAGKNIKVVVKGDGIEKTNTILKSGKGFNEISCSLDGSEFIQVEFTGRESPDIYGISIESKTGIILDNIPQRGSAGLEFTMVGKNNLSEAYRELSPDLFILHYGLNIVKNVSRDYSYYERGLTRQLRFLQEVSPGTPVLMIGLTDMARKIGDSIKSYPNIPVIIETQRNASRKAGVSFWDAYSAMGGESSIVSWAGKQIPLAQKDFVHLTYNGADTLSKIIADELFTEKPKIVRNEFYIELDSIIPENTLPVEPSVTGAEKKSAQNKGILSLLSYNPQKPLIFTTAHFWMFFLIVLAGYTLIYKKPVLRNAYLFLFSLFFYYKSGGFFLFLLILVIVVDFTIGILIHNSEKKFFRRLFVFLSILTNLGILAYFKYTDLIVNTINDLFGTEIKSYDYLASFSNLYLGTSFSISNIILPVGISFFTFQSLSYVFDVYRRKTDPVRNIIDFGFYVSFFPQLVAGPIVRASEFIPQIYDGFHLAKREFSHAIFLISKGLIKKIIIADFIAINFIDRVFDSPSIYSGFENLMAVYGYGLQIYCDFSGYTDIAIGLALILGFRLPVNFNSPYKATGLSDFWKRWHISLSRWLKDYIYIPLGGNRKGRFRAGINIMITMILGGLWHGASIRFLIWGFLHGIGIIFNRIWNFLVGSRIKAGRFGRAFAVFLTFHFVSFCWIFFRADGMGKVNEILKQITQNFSPGSYMNVLPAYSNVFLLIIVGYLIHFLPERVKESYRGLFIRIPVYAQLAIIFVFAVLLYQMRSTDVMPFIYFRF